jgi:hypothetical protein
MEHQKAEYLGCGMDSLVAKPLQITQLLGAISAHAGGAQIEPILAVG